MKSCRAVALIALVLIASAARVDTRPQSAAQVPQPGTTVTFQDGLVIQSSNGENRLVLGMVAQTDGRFSLNDSAPLIDTFLVRKARPTFSGRVARYFDFKLMPDFGSGTAVILDAYLDVRFSPAFRVRTGKDKTPVGYELLEGDAYLLFPERSLASSLVPNRDVGVQVQGDVRGGTISYAGGVFNGIPDAASSVTDLDTNDAKDIAGRILLQPFRNAAHPGPLQGLGFHLGASTGRQDGALPAFRTSVQQTYFSYAPGVTASGARRRLAPAVFFYYGSLGCFAEYVRSTQAVAGPATVTDVTNQAWDVSASYLVTGEAASRTVVRPKDNFDPVNGHWGALQVVARYSALKVDPAVLRLGLAAARSSQRASQFTVGANWYPAPYIKYYLTLERTTFAGGVRSTEAVVILRAQLAF